MAQISPLLRNAEGGHLIFWCPGCDEPHGITVGNGGWGWNGDANAPTFTPSVLVTCGHYDQGHQGDCWCTYNQKHPNEKTSFECSRCHSFITDGKIQFLTDSTHKLSGQTVPLAPWPANY